MQDTTKLWGGKFVSLREKERVKSTQAELRKQTVDRSKVYWDIVLKCIERILWTVPTCMKYTQHCIFSFGVTQLSHSEKGPISRSYMNYIALVEVSSTLASGSTSKQTKKDG